MWINAWGKKKQLSHYNRSTDYTPASSVSKKKLATKVSVHRQIMMLVRIKLPVRNISRTNDEVSRTP